jgi:DNA modification methylase
VKIISVARRPISEGSVAATVLKHGTGAIHIDAARIQAEGEVISTHSQSKKAAFDERKVYGKYAGDMETHQTTGQALGRWPNNLILLHLPECGSICSPGCPVPAIDVQSGVTKSSGGRAYQNTNDMYSGNWGHKGKGVAEDPGFGDIGGVSRYFKQIQGGLMSEGVPQDLLDYLRDLIHPSHLADSKTLLLLDLTGDELSKYEDEEFHGAIIQSPATGDPTPYMDDIWRIVKPGGHVLLIANDAEPTGHTGACALEDKGFEIRDAILVAQEAGAIHYVPKANKKERHAGTGDLARKREPEAVYELDDDGWAYAEDIQASLAEAGVGDDIIEGLEENGIPRSLIPKSVREFFNKREPKEEDENKAPGGGNDHPTVKPKDVLVRLLEDVPKDATVLDPFMGSGSMGIACLETGHSYIGVEKQAEYIEIADTRIRHWDRSRAGWVSATIKSDATKDEPDESEELGLDDLFGF